MKRLWSALISRGDDGWWNLRTSEGDPPAERSFLYKFHALIQQVRRMMENTNDASTTAQSSNGDARKD